MTVPGWAAFGKLYIERVQQAKGGETFVEIGSWLGRSAALMAVEIINSKKDIQFYCVDPWSDGGPDLKHKVDQMRLPYLDKTGKERFDLYQLFLKNTQRVAHIIHPIRKPSLDAVHHFAEGTIDFLMIDGSHQYQDVCEDIDAWLPKMKRGGMISGDDYNWSGVERAVKEKFSGMDVKVVELPKAKNNVSKKPAYWMVQL